MNKRTQNTNKKRLLKFPKISLSHNANMGERYRDSSSSLMDKQDSLESRIKLVKERVNTACIVNGRSPNSVTLPAYQKQTQ